MPCPKNVDIPGAFSAYNRKYAEGWFSAMREYIMGTALRKDGSGASNCVGCGKCEKHCPQNIEIVNELKQVRRELEGPIYAVVRWVVRKFKAF